MQPSMCRCDWDSAQGLHTGYWVQYLFPHATGLYIARTKTPFYELFSFKIASYLVIHSDYFSALNRDKNDFHECKFILWIQL